MLVSEEVSFDHNREQMPSRLIKAEVRRGGLPSRATFQEILLIQISITEAQDRGKPLKYLEIKLLQPH